MPAKTKPSNKGSGKNSQPRNNAGNDDDDDNGHQPRAGGGAAVAGAGREASAAVQQQQVRTRFPPPPPGAVTYGGDDPGREIIVADLAMHLIAMRKLWTRGTSVRVDLTSTMQPDVLLVWRGTTANSVFDDGNVTINFVKGRSEHLELYGRGSSDEKTIPLVFPDEFEEAWRIIAVHVTPPAPEPATAGRRVAHAGGGAAAAPHLVDVDNDSNSNNDDT
jgi:hypothetical protein